MVLIPWFHVSSAGLFTSQDGHDGRLKDLVLRASLHPPRLKSYVCPILLFCDTNTCNSLSPHSSMRPWFPVILTFITHSSSPRKFFMLSSELWTRLLVSSMGVLAGLLPSQDPSYAYSQLGLP